MATMTPLATVPDMSIGKRRRDYRGPTLLLAFVIVGALGYGFSLLPSRGVEATSAVSSPASTAPGFTGLSEAASGRQDVSASAALELAIDSKDPDGPQARKLLMEAGEQIKLRRYEEAIQGLHQAQPLLKKYPEAYVLLGRALEGRKDYAAARDFYQAAINRNPFMADAYWGFGTASEALGDLPSALGAMRSYLHTEPNKDPSRLRIAQARSAIWEWESKMGRGPWGPTKGVPPGFTADELKRDGKGVGTKMPVPGTEGPDGRMQSEIKSGKKIEIFKKP
jgi:hypothetical protein